MNTLVFFKNDLEAPDGLDTNEWADFVEISCLSQPDQIFTLDASVDEKEDANLGEAFEKETEDSSSGIISEENLPDLFPADTKEEYENLSSNAFDAPKRDRLIQRIRNAFEQIQSRSNVYGEAYPFKIEKGTIITTRKNLNQIHHLYIILLLAANLRLTTKSGTAKIGNLFEWLCGPFFRALIPIKSECHHFGAAANSEGLFSGGLNQKIDKLCEVLNISKDLRAENLPASGDGGLDWIAYRKFNDLSWNVPVFFAQCACGGDWVNKQEEASEAQWESRIVVQFPIMVFLFTPRNLRTNSNDFHKPENIRKEIVLIDRYRLIEMAGYFDGKSMEEALNLFAPVSSEFKQKNKIFV